MNELGDGERAPISPGSVGGALPVLARAVLLAFLLFGTYVRVAGVWCQALYGDEEHAHPHLLQGHGHVLSHFDAVASPIGFLFLQRLAIDVLGASVLSYRLPSMLAGVLGLWLLYPLGRRLVGRGPAWLATLLLAVHPLHVFYSRFARPYALVFLLALVLVYALVRALEGRRGAWIGAGLAAAFLPWVHLSTAVPVALVAAAGVILAWRQPSRPVLGRSLIAFGAAGALCLALYAPALESLVGSLRWLSTVRGKGDARLAPVLTLLGGSVVGGCVLTIGTLLAGILLARRRQPSGPIFLIALAAPGAIWLSDTWGSEVAYARYQFIALVPLLLAPAWGLFELLGGIRAPFLRGNPGYATGLALVSLQALVNPIPVGSLFGAFSNHKHWLIPEPALTRPFSLTPAIYHQLARAPRRLTVVEFPLTMQATLLFDNYQRQHRQRTLVGVTTGIEGVYAQRPYVSLLELDLAHTDIDCVIVHKDVRSEVERFFEELSPLRKTTERGITVEDRMQRRLLAAWGQPTFEDELVQAWLVERP